MVFTGSEHARNARMRRRYILLQRKNKRFKHCTQSSHNEPAVIVSSHSMVNEDGTITTRTTTSADNSNYYMPGICSFIKRNIFYNDHGIPSSSNVVGQDQYLFILISYLNFLNTLLLYVIYNFGNLPIFWMTH